MENIDIIPAPPLLAFIHRYTFMSVAENRPAEKCIPSGFIRMYILDADSDLEIITFDGRREILKDAIEGHPNEQLHSTQVKRKLNLIMCSFYPSRFYQTFNIPIHHLNNQLVLPENIFGNAYKGLKEQLHNTPAYSKKAEVLDEFFKCYFNNNHCRKANTIDYLQHIILHKKGNININTLYESFGKSRRSMERHFLEEVGVGPKYFCRILRFNHSYALKRKYPTKSWNEILYLCGYYDQSHYIRDFKGFMGISPDSYFQERHSNLDVFTGKNEVWSCEQSNVERSRLSSAQFSRVEFTKINTVGLPASVCGYKSGVHVDHLTCKRV
jgi:AraC-like DNA-binding protein